MQQVWLIFLLKAHISLTRSTRIILKHLEGKQRELTLLPHVNWTLTRLFACKLSFHPEVKYVQAHSPPVSNTGALQQGSKTLDQMITHGCFENGLHLSLLPPAWEMQNIIQLIVYITMLPVIDWKHLELGSDFLDAFIETKHILKGLPRLPEVVHESTPGVTGLLCIAYQEWKGQKLALLPSISSQQFISVCPKALTCSKDLTNILYLCKQCSLAGTCTPLVYTSPVCILYPDVLTVERVGGRESTVL